MPGLARIPPARTPRSLAPAGDRPSARPSAQLSRLGLRSPRRYLLLPRPCPAPATASAGEAARAARPRRPPIGRGAGRAGRPRRRPSVIGRGRTSSRLSGRRLLRRGGVGEVQALSPGRLSPQGSQACLVPGSL